MQDGENQRINAKEKGGMIKERKKERKMAKCLGLESVRIVRGSEQCGFG